jgi:hypothetical protein
MMQEYFFKIVCVACVLKQVWFATHDMTHYYWAALKWELKSALICVFTFHFKASLKSLHTAILVVGNYLTAIPNLIRVHYKHRIFLHKLGFENNEELTGTYMHAISIFVSPALHILRSNIQVYLYIHIYMHIYVYTYL